MHQPVQTSCRQRGVVSVEMAFLLPVFIGLLLLFADVVRVHWQYSTLEHAMRRVLREHMVDSVRGGLPSATVLKQDIQASLIGKPDFSLSVTRYGSLAEMLQADGGLAPDEAIPLAPSDPVLRVTAVLKPAMTVYPLFFAKARTLEYRTTLIMLSDRMPE
ncbi:pilus assembly protein [Photobacterium sp. WH77]|uniref:TadE/TadG family type IV pilus assembly protein n=1 Tax=Photobacterium TaxID=657 RepID=UPI001C492856|nr:MULTISPECIES: TadE family protein [Photobacterium]MBV7262703.1 pilus assembly protein [Photobacterium sp. WH24]MCG2837831.1 pilus assembly protein [Photobacterium sp. WH77]MCG2845448.1 pilus assembly protein [Photobacterium sp. WH80]MDO6582230.1 pilus assembly protein [Photobacterium sp. 2_MG-2023]